MPRDACLSGKYYAAADVRTGIHRHARKEMRVIAKTDARANTALPIDRDAIA